MSSPAGYVPRRNLDAGLAGGRLRRSDAVRYPATSVPFSNSTDGLDVGAVAGYQLFVLFEELGRLWRPPPVLPSLPRHDAAPPQRGGRHAATPEDAHLPHRSTRHHLSFASLLRPSRATFIAPEGRRATVIAQRSLARQPSRSNRQVEWLTPPGRRSVQGEHDRRRLHAMAPWLMGPDHRTGRSSKKDAPRS